MPHAYSLTTIAESGQRFRDFRPYVAAINDDGLVAFQATLARGETGIFVGRGGPVTTLCESGGNLRSIDSHPDIDASGRCCSYGTDRSGRRGVFMLTDGRPELLADDAGPLGPTINSRGDIAFRSAVPGGVAGIRIARDNTISTIADTRHFAAFHGIPVVNSSGQVAFRADLAPDRAVIMLATPPASNSPIDPHILSTIATADDDLASLGSFPALDDTGTVAFAAVLQSGRSGIFSVSQGRRSLLLETGDAFESCRGVLLGPTPIFFATPRGGTLGIFTGPDPKTDELLRIGSPFMGSAVADFALNSVSINRSGQLALRIALADGRQFILRADPPSAESPPPRTIGP